MPRKTTAKSGKKSRKRTSSTNRRSGRSRAARPQSKPSLIPSDILPKITLPVSNLSLDRKLDILGIGMTGAGLLTLFGLLATDSGKLLGAWIRFLGQSVGWGLYILPVGLIIVGAWLIARKFERIPQLTFERALGLGLLLFQLLTTFHFLLFSPTRETAYALASEGYGGGYIGAWLHEFLRRGLGTGGEAIVLLAWLLIAVTLTLDTSILDLFRWVRPLVLKIQDYWDEVTTRRENGKARYLPVPPPSGNVPTSTPSGEQHSVTPAGEVTLEMSEGEIRTWILPPIHEILEYGEETSLDDEYDRQRAQLIEETLASFGAPARVVEINRGPTITQFGVEPLFIESRGKQVRVRVNKISALADDLALALSATRIRIQAPVPGKGFVGIEVPNENISLVALRDSIESEAFKRLEGRPLRFALGQDVAGNAVAADLAALPHLLIAGTTGSGKSVCVNAIISCLLLHNTPDDLRMIMVDPKRVELTGYNGIPHLLAPVVVELERVVGALQWITREMDQRYRRFAEVGARNLEDYNQRMTAQGERKLPYLLIVIDELADLMMLAPDETERTLTRLAQMARATGIHMIISTQRPSVDVVTGLIKANFPARIAFAVASGVDSRVILDQPGAERLLGRGDMLFQAPDAASPVRLQGVFVSDAELQRLVQFWRAQSRYAAPASVSTAAGGVPDAIPAGIPLKQMPLWEDMEPEEEIDPLFDEAVDLVRRQGRASISMLQRRLRIGYTRAGRLIALMEDKGIVSPPQGGLQYREVLDYGDAAPPPED